MTHITKEQIEQGARAEVGDTFSHGDTQYIAVQMVYAGRRIVHVCRGCAFYRNGKDTCLPDMVPDCVSEDVIFAEDHSPKG